MVYIHRIDRWKENTIDPQIRIDILIYWNIINIGYNLYGDL